MRSRRAWIIGAAALTAALWACTGGGTDVDMPVCGDGVREGTEQCDSGPGCTEICTMMHPPFEPRQVTARWQLVRVDGAEVGCPAGAEMALVHVEDLLDGPTTVLPWPCVAGEGVVTLPSDRVRMWIALTSVDRATTYATSLTHERGAGVGDLLDFIILDDGGYFELTWSLQTSARAPRTCAEAIGTAGIRVTATSVADPTRVLTETYPCDEYGARLPALVAGAYDVRVEAINGSGAVIGTAPALTGRVIEARNRVTTLGDALITY